MLHKLGIPSFSLGAASAGHTIEAKLEAAQKHGFQGIEIDYSDIQDVASRHPTRDTHQDEIQAATLIKDLCRDHSIEIICLQSFIHFGGLQDRHQHAIKIRELQHWLDLAHTLGTDIIQIPSTFLPDAEIGNEETLVQDLQEAADLGASTSPIIRFAYEALCWGQYQYWEDSWRIVQAVNRPNFGLCLDTFHIAGRVYADPTSSSGLNAGADTAMEDTITRLKQTDVAKVFYVQVEDAQRLDGPLIDGHPLYDFKQDSRRIWSRNYRLFYGEQEIGAYLPIQSIVKAIVHDLGYRGWLSFELFNSRANDADPAVVGELSERGARAWAKLVADLDLSKID